MISSLVKILLITRGGPPKDGKPGSGHYDHKKELDAEDPKMGEDAERAFHHHAFAFEQGLGYDEKDAIRGYIGFHYVAINSQLRKTKPPDWYENAAEQDKLNPEIMRKEAALLYRTAKPLPYDAVVYRGVHSDRMGDYAVGSVIKDRGFVSTSIDRHVASTFPVGKDKEGKSTKAYWNKNYARIHVPKGTPVLFNRTNEKEIVLRPGTRFKVLGRTDTEVHMQVT